jgi:hypothetical protein
MKSVRFGCVLALLAGCGGDETGHGAVSVRAYGESFIEDGIPASAVDDGWAIEFSRFEVTFRDVLVGGVALSDAEPVALHEASEAGGHELGSVSVGAGRHGSPSFTIARVDVEGLAEKDGVAKTFSWLFDAPTRYEHCQTTTEVKQDETTSFQITVHADHLFYDSLVSEEPQLSFQPLADADADADGEVTQAELAEQDIGPYDPGNLDLSDQWSFLVAQHRTLGHVDGEGHCEAAASD